MVGSIRHGSAGRQRTLVVCGAGLHWNWDSDMERQMTNQDYELTLKQE
jgi:hypothetical protein